MKQLESDQVITADPVPPTPTIQEKPEPSLPARVLTEGNLRALPVSPLQKGRSKRFQSKDGLTLLFGLAQHDAQGVSLFMVVPTSLVGAFAHARLGNVERSVVAPVALVSVVAAIAAAAVAHALPALTRATCSPGCSSIRGRGWCSREAGRRARARLLRTGRRAIGTS